MEIVSSSFNLANVVEIFSCKAINRLRTSKELTGGSYRPYLGWEGDELAGILSSSRRVVLRFEVRVKGLGTSPMFGDEDGGGLVFKVVREGGG